jgi:hypothetical protein
VNPNPAYEACIARVRRADMHLESLNTLLSDFIKSGAYSVVAHPDLDTFRHTREIVLTAKVSHDPPSLPASLVVADILNNLRSALDNLVWALSVEFQPVPPPYPIPQGDPWRDVKFPVTLYRRDWKGALGSQLKLVDPTVHAKFERLQPFDRRQHDPERDEFAVLNELWNTDKHRHLLLTEFFLGLDGVRSGFQAHVAANPAGKVTVQQATKVGDPPPPPPVILDEAGRAEHHRRLLESAAEHQYSIIVQHPAGPVEDGTELGRVRESSTGGFIIMNPEMHVDPDLVFDVAFEKRSPANGELVMPTLATLRDEVWAALEMFRDDL